VYRDTYQGQPYEIPPAPAGLTVPGLGFGWLYHSDQELARRLGYGISDEMTLVAQIRPLMTADGPTLQLQLSQELPGFPNPLVLAYTDEPGLTYCFPRMTTSGRRAELNTWVAVQRFEHGFMLWRQDQPNRVEVAHEDTDLAPEIGCLDRFADSWRPGEELDYGPLAIPGRYLPERGFGKIWLQHSYVRESLGYPIALETGGFAELSFRTFQHPRRGELAIRDMVVHLPTGEDLDIRLTTEGGTGPLRETFLTQWCSSMLIPHQPL
jgi:hypothetical protein